MYEENAHWQTTEYEGFEIHVATPAKTEAQASEHQPTPSVGGYTYIGYVCHPGADPKLPGHAVPFHSDGDDAFPTEEAARDEAVHVGRSIVDGTHPDLTVLPLVTGGA